MKRIVFRSALCVLVILVCIIVVAFLAASAPVWISLSTGSWWWMLLYVCYFVAVWAYCEYEKELKHCND